jgi:hypothetical protein
MPDDDPRPELRDERTTLVGNSAKQAQSATVV